MTMLWKKTTTVRKPESSTKLQHGDTLIYVYRQMLVTYVYMYIQTHWFIERKQLQPYQFLKASGFLGLEWFSQQPGPCSASIKWGPQHPHGYPMYVDFIYIYWVWSSCWYSFCCSAFYWDAKQQLVMRAMVNVADDWRWGHPTGKQNCKKRKHNLVTFIGGSMTFSILSIFRSIANIDHGLSGNVSIFPSRQ